MYGKSTKIRRKKKKKKKKKKKENWGRGVGGGGGGATENKSQGSLRPSPWLHESQMRYIFEVSVYDCTSKLMSVKKLNLFANTVTGQGREARLDYLVLPTELFPLFGAL